MSNSNEQFSGQTKKCPFCAEEINQEAIKCKHCGSSVLKISEKKQTAKEYNYDKQILKGVKWVVVVLVAIYFFYVSAPILLLWYIWKKTKLDKKKKYIGTILVVVLFGVLIGFYFHLNRIPSLVITEPNDGLTIQSSETIVKGAIDPKDATLNIDGVVTKTENGEFNYKAKLLDEKNVFILKVSNSNGQSEQEITINRTFTKEELAEYERKKAEEEVKKQVAIEAQKKVEQEESEIKKAEEEASVKTTMIEKQFSAWDGSHVKLSRLIKDSMNDSDSYEHIETKYWDMKDYLIVNTIFSGKNAFGGVVKNTVKAKISLDGENIEILEQY